MKTAVIDVESTIFQKGNPFAQRNRLCYVGVGTGIDWFIYDLRMDATGLGADEVMETIDGYDWLVGFNFKFDLHWLRRAHCINLNNKKIWDCQVAEWMLSGQRLFLNENSLDKAAERYGTARKSGDMAEYWSRGIDTPDVPVDVSRAYLKQDLICTWEVYQKQRERFEKGDPRLFNLFKMHMDDLLVLEEMEWNGFRLNVERCLKLREEQEKRLEEIDLILKERCPNTPINWDSGDDVSAYLYGGTIEVDRKEPVGLFKTGKKIGEVRYRWITDTYTLPRLVDPIEGSELKKADKEKGTGPWSTAEDVLKQLKQIREVKLLLERAKISKLLDYLIGFPELIATMNWKESEIHGQFNQVIARTGRLSSSNPNVQNLPDPILQLMETRYAC